MTVLTVHPQEIVLLRFWQPLALPVLVLAPSVWYNIDQSIWVVRVLDVTASCQMTVFSFLITLVN